ncbi:MAG: DUF1302 family protein [Desulfobacterales bacterium]
MRYKKNRRNMLGFVVLVFGVFLVCGSADAMRFGLSRDTIVDFDVTLSWAGGWRVEDRDLDNVAMKLPGGINSDDGGWNFDQWDMINNRFSAIADIDIQHKNVGVFLRPRAFYDFVYMNENSNPGLAKHPFNNNFLAGAIDEPDEFDDELEEVMGYDVDILDYFAYANFELLSRLVDLRVGQQVIAWGEQLYLSGGVASAMSHADLTAANVPGVELREIYLPSESVSMRMDLLSNLSMAAFYQWEWEEHILNESGSYFSTTDMLDQAGYAIIAGVNPETGAPILIRRGNDDDPSEGGQYGFMLMYRSHQLLETEFGFYYINYHEKAPMVLLDPFTFRYYLGYGEDIKLYGASFSSLVGQVQVSGEITYRKDYPINITSFVYEPGNMVQAQLSWLYLLGQNPVFDDVTIAGEVGMNKVQGLDNDDMEPSDFSWGLALAVTPKYYQLIPNLDVEFPINFKYFPNGSSPNNTFQEGQDSGSIGVNFTWKNVYKANLKYVAYFNNNRYGLADRDFIGVDLKYTF